MLIIQKFIQTIMFLQSTPPTPVWRMVGLVKVNDIDRRSTVDEWFRHSTCRRDGSRASEKTNRESDGVTRFSPGTFDYSYSSLADNHRPGLGRRQEGECGHKKTKP